MKVEETRLTELDLSLGRFRQLPACELRGRMESLKKKGQLSPLVAGAHEGRLVLVDGFVRYVAAEKLGWEKLEVEILEMSPLQMKVQLYVRNRERGFVLYEECRLIRELSEQDGLSQVEIGQLLERHKSWVCRRLSLVRQLSPSLLEEVSLCSLGSGSLTKLAQLQPRNQEEVWAALKREGVKGQESRQVIELYRKAKDPEARSYVLEYPKEALRLAKGKREAKLEVRLGEAGREVLSLLESLRRVGLSLSRRLREGVEELVPEGKEVLRQAARRAWSDSQAALEQTEEFLLKTGRKRDTEADGQRAGRLVVPGGARRTSRTVGGSERLYSSKERGKIGDGTQTKSGDRTGEKEAPRTDPDDVPGAGDAAGHGTGAEDEHQYGPQGDAEPGHSATSGDTNEASEQAGPVSTADPDVGPGGGL